MTTPLEILGQGIEQWNEWRSRQSHVPCSLSGQDLSHGYFFEGDFRNVDLSGANLCRACLVGADFRGANLSGADLNGAYLADANFQGANLKNTDLSKAQLDRADMRFANLIGTQLQDADISQTQLSDPNKTRYVEEVALLLRQSPLTTATPTPKTSEQSSTSEQNSSEQNSEQNSERKTPYPKRLVNTEKLPLNQSVGHRFLQRTPSTRTLKQSSRPRAHWDRRQQETDRRQSIRQSTFVLPSKKGEQPAVQWGRRREDRTTAVLPEQSASVRQRWRPTVVATATAAAIALPLTLSYVWTSIRTSSHTKAIKADVTLVSGPGTAVASSDGSSDTSTVQSWSVVGSITSDRNIQSIATYTKADGSSRVVLGAADGEIEIWDALTGEQLSILSGHADSVSALAASDNGRWLVSGGADGLSVWRPEAGELVHHIPQFDSDVSVVAIAPQSNTFISSSRTGNTATTTVWTLNDGQPHYQLNHPSEVRSISIAPDARSFITSDNAAVSQQWDTATGQLQLTMPVAQKTEHSNLNVDELGIADAIAFDATKSVLVSKGKDNTVKIWQQNQQNL